MDYQEELLRLQGIITSDRSTEGQRNLARKAIEVLIDDSIKDAFSKIEKRTQEYDKLVRRLGKVIDSIADNQLIDVMKDIGEFAEDVKEASTGNGQQ
jgi:hypothetical protein